MAVRLGFMANKVEDDEIWKHTNSVCVCIQTDIIDGWILPL